MAFPPIDFIDNKFAKGLPTILLLPNIATCFPSGFESLLSNNSLIPAGVAGIKRGVPADNNPELNGCNPSTSLIGSIF